MDTTTTTDTNPTFTKCPSCGGTNFRYAVYEMWEADLSTGKVYDSGDGGIDEDGSITCKNCGYDCTNEEGALDVIAALDVAQA